MQVDPAAGQYAVLINAFARVELTGNTISGKRTYLGPGFRGRARIAGNVLADITDHGISVQGGTAEITGNRISRCAGHCVELHPAISGCTVTGNELIPGPAGEACRDAGRGNVVSDNQGAPA